MHFYRCTDFADPAAYATLEDFFADLARDFPRGDRRTSPRPAAATSSSTRSRSRCSAIRPSAQKVEAAGLTPDRLVDLYIKSINDAVAGAPADVVFGVHMCRGNFKGHYLAAGGYESVAERFFSHTRRESLPARIRHRARRRLRAAALRQRQRASCSGLSAARSPALEAVDELKRRIDEATQVHRPRPAGDQPAMRLCLHRRRQSGHRSDERDKLHLVVKAGHTVWS